MLLPLVAAGMRAPVAHPPTMPAPCDVVDAVWFLLLLVCVVQAEDPQPTRLVDDVRKRVEEGVAAARQFQAEEAAATRAVQSMTGLREARSTTEVSPLRRVTRHLPWLSLRSTTAPLCGAGADAAAFVVDVRTVAAALVYRVPCTLCPVPCALCPVPCALCPVPCALCPV